MTNVINTLKNAIAAMADCAIEYSKRAEQVRFIRARGEATDDEVRELVQAVLLAKVKDYKDQVHPESGKPAKGSAYQRAVSRMMSDTNPNKGLHANHERKAPRVPRELQAAVDKLLTTYDAAVIRAALKRAA